MKRGKAQAQAPEWDRLGDTVVDYIVQIPAQMAPLLKALRRSRGFTQKRLAEHLGVTQQAIHQLEKHPERATLERLLRACTILGVDIVLRVAEERQDAAP